ncbi:MAG: hypothetical protein HFI15_17140 [Lachnospiraceae bacterium]|jgi:hypothetical protein|nr:hypothetical protein [Lachnospiraceae bacterium]
MTDGKRALLRVNEICYTKNRHYNLEHKICRKVSDPMILEKKDDDILIQTLHGLIKSWETEIIEFKEA